jgi:hypothetical protein
MIVSARRQSAPELSRRLDPRYWDRAYERLHDACQFPLEPLGQCIRHISYGPIITGRTPPPAGEDGVVVLHQGQLRFSGVDLSEALVVPAGCDWDLPRARVERGDLVLARSGAGSLGRNRVCVYDEPLPAVAGSFVDVIRLEDIHPQYVAAFLKTAQGWGQVHRIINGVGTPNISHEEIADLLIPRVPLSAQWRVGHRYQLGVAPPHREGCRLKLEGLSDGLTPAEARQQPRVLLALEQARAAYRGILGDLEAYLLGQRAEI